MAQQAAQDFNTMFGEFMLDLNGDSVPDVAIPREAAAPRVRVAGGGDALMRGLARGVTGAAAAAVPPLVDMKMRGDDSVVARMLSGEQPATPQPQPQARGGVLNMLNLPEPAPEPPRNALMEGLNSAAGVADYVLMGIPSTAAGLVNAAIPGQPLGGLDEAKASAADAQRAAANTRLGRDLMAMPSMLAGAGPGTLSAGASLMPGRGPRRILSEEAATRFNDDLAAGNQRLQQMTAPPPLALPSNPGSTDALVSRYPGVFDRQNAGIVQRRANPEREVLQGAQDRAAIQSREALRRQQEAPRMTRQDTTARVDDAITALLPNYEQAVGTRGNMMQLIDDVAAATGAQPWQVLRAMADKGYDLSGLTRAAFQAPRESGRFGPMTEDARALWDMVRYDQDVLYRQRGAPYQAQPRNALMPPASDVPMPPLPPGRPNR